MSKLARLNYGYVGIAVFSLLSMMWGVPAKVAWVVVFAAVLALVMNIHVMDSMECKKSGGHCSLNAGHAEGCVSLNGTRLS